LHRDDDIFPAAMPIKLHRDQFRWTNGRGHDQKPVLYSQKANTYGLGTVVLPPRPAHQLLTMQQAKKNMTRTNGGPKPSTTS
jgi:hypothetical protein